MQVITSNTQTRRSVEEARNVGEAIGGVVGEAVDFCVVTGIGATAAAAITMPQAISTGAVLGSPLGPVGTVIGGLLGFTTSLAVGVLGGIASGALAESIDVSDTFVRGCLAGEVDDPTSF